jgi:hypothetical protein
MNILWISQNVPYPPKRASGRDSGHPSNRDRPGEEAHVDFGFRGPFLDPDRGRVPRLGRPSVR